MPDATVVLGRLEDAPTDTTVEELDVRDLPPPEPMTATFEHLEALPDGTVLLQVNDRAPKFIYPKLAERGYAHETVETTEAVYTAIWAAEG